MSENANLIEAESLVKRYDGTAVVKGISFSVAKSSGCWVPMAPARPPPS
jgi:hypothetical protein